MAFVGGNFHGIHTDNQLGQSLERMWNEQRWMTKDEALAVLMNPAPYWTHNVAINDMQERNNSFFRLITEAAYAVLVDNSEAGPLHGNQWVNYTLHGRAYEYPLDLRSSLPANPDQQLRFPCFELRGKHRGRRRWVLPANYQQLTGNPNPGGVLIQWRVFPMYDKLHWRHAAHALRQQQEAANGGPLPRPMGVPGVGSPAAPLPLPPGTRAPRGRLPQFPGAPPLQYPAIPPAGGHVADGDGGNNDNDHGHGRGHGRGHGGGGGGGGAGGAGGGRGHAGAGGHGMYGAQGGAGGHAWGGAPGGAGGAGGNIHFHGDFHLTSIKNDDKVIQAEGVESLSEEELRQACREELRDWLDPSLKSCYAIGPSRTFKENET